MIGTNAEDVRIEGGVVELAERKTIRNDRLTERMAVGEEVRSVEQFPVPQPADGTGLSVCVENPSTERGLVEALDGESGDVTAPSVRDLYRLGIRNSEPAVVD